MMYTDPTGNYNEGNFAYNYYNDYSYSMNYWDFSYDFNYDYSFEPEDWSLDSEDVWHYYEGSVAPAGSNYVKTVKDGSMVFAKIISGAGGNRTHVLTSNTYAFYMLS